MDGFEKTFINLINRGKEADLSLAESKETKKVMKAMAAFPSILRFEYAKALLKHEDLTQAQKIKGKFDRSCRTYPNKGSIESEKELIALVDSRYEALRANGSG